MMLIAGAAALAAGCASSTPDPGKESTERRKIDVQVDSALGELFTNAPGARELANKSASILVFPEVFTAGLLVGGSHGHGALRKGTTTTTGYYALNVGSVGLLAGAATRTLYIFFMTQEALNRFQQSEGWTIGGDASVVVLDSGAMSRLGRDAPAIFGLVRNQQGFLANLSLDGTKISKLKI